MCQSVNLTVILRIKIKKLKDLLFRTYSHITKIYISPCQTAYYLPAECFEYCMPKREKREKWPCRQHSIKKDKYREKYLHKQTPFEAVSADNGNILKHNRKLAF